jgi:propanol-preferring alcohol dehydrogenase
MTNSWAQLPHPTQPGQVGGHEGVGKIVKMGAGTETSAVKVGDRVGIKWLSGICGNCPPCLSGHDGQCFNQKISGYYTAGTFQQYALGPANYVTPIPESLESADAAPMLCAGVTVYSALSKSGAKSGDWVVLLGAGGGVRYISLQPCTLVIPGKSVS